MVELKIWVVMKKSPNLELALGLEECEKSHTLTTTTTASRNSQKEANNEIDNQNQCSVLPKRSLLYRLLVLDEVKCKTHTKQQNPVDSNHLRLCQSTSPTEIS